jgi:hypothetical protein
MKFLKRNSSYLLDFVFLAILFWVARYLFSARFGLYEDDLTRIPDAFSLNLSGLWNHIVFLMTHYYANRPLHEGFIYIFSWLGWQIGGLWGAYWMGYLITVINVGLFYALLTRLHSRTLGVLGGLAYVFFSADTTQAYLTMSLGGQISNTLLLLAFHVYLFGSRWLSYLIICPVILFFYETPFLVFLAAPLLDRSRRGKGFWKGATLHVGILATMLLGSFLMRYTQRGNVNFELSYQETITTALTHLIEGPAVAIGTYFLRPYQTLRQLNLEVSLVSVVTFALVALFLYYFIPEDRRDIGKLVRIVQAGKFSDLDDDTRWLLQLIVAGFLMLLLAYPMTFTTRITAISGRATRGHLAGVSGASLLFACFAYMLQAILSFYQRRTLAILFLSGWFALLAGFGLTIQNDYVIAWRAQKAFWSELLPLIPDAGNGTAILVEPDGLEDVLQIGANTWNLSRVLDQIYQFPSGSRSVPRVYRLLPDWKTHLLAEDGSFQMNESTVTAPPDNYNSFDSSSVILIKTQNGTISRVDGPIELGGRSYPLKHQSQPILPDLPRQLLYQLILDPSAP